MAMVFAILAIGALLVVSLFAVLINIAIALEVLPRIAADERRGHGGGARFDIAHPRLRHSR